MQWSLALHKDLTSIYMHSAAVRSGRTDRASAALKALVHDHYCFYLLFCRLVPVSMDSLLMAGKGWFPDVSSMSSWYTSPLMLYSFL